MKVEVRLFVSFRQSRWKSKYFIFDDQVKVKDILENLNIQKEQLGIALINGRHCGDIDTFLSNEDIVSLFPPIGGG